MSLCCCGGGPLYVYVCMYRIMPTREYWFNRAIAADRSHALCILAVCQLRPHFSMAHLPISAPLRRGVM